jgi:hypothetical protein
LFVCNAVLGQPAVNKYFVLPANFAASCVVYAGHWYHWLFVVFVLVVLQGIELIGIALIVPTISAGSYCNI